MKLYLEIADKQNYEKLVIKGRASIDECFEVWEGILKTQGRTTGNMSYSNYFNLSRQYGLLIAKYNIVKACLLKLARKHDASIVSYLKGLGYLINTSDNLAYATSIKIALQTSNNIMTKIESKRRELDKIAKTEDKVGVATIGQIVADTNAALEGRYIDENVLLSEYNRYREIIQKKNGRGQRNP